MRRNEWHGDECGGRKFREDSREDFCFKIENEEIKSLCSNAGTPRNISFQQVKEALSHIEGVKQTHDLNIWALTTSKCAVSVHLAIGETIYLFELLIYH